jgi:hypothetical protein
MADALAVLHSPAWQLQSGRWIPTDDYDSTSLIRSARQLLSICIPGQNNLAYRCYPWCELTRALPYSLRQAPAPLLFGCRLPPQGCGVRHFLYWLRICKYKFSPK